MSKEIQIKVEVPVSSISKKNTSEPTQQTEANINPETKEVNGPKGLEPTRYGDWERNGRCYDF